MPLPSVPSVVGQAAARHQLGSLLWVQPAAVQGNIVSEQGDYFYQHGLVVAFGARIETEVRLWRNVTCLDWDLHAKVWNEGGTRIFQRFRVWDIVFNDGSEHNAELSERPTGALPFALTTQAQAERRVMIAIVRATRGDMPQRLHDEPGPISAGENIVLYGDHFSVRGIDYKWAQLKGVRPDIDWQNFSPVREEQKVVVKMSLEVEQPSRPLGARFSLQGKRETVTRVLRFAPNEIDLPLMYYMVSEMPYRSQQAGN